MALHYFPVLDTPAEEVFDRITLLVARLLDAPIAFIALVDHDRLWFKARVGLDAAETQPALAFCDRVIGCDDLLVISDAAADPLFGARASVPGAHKLAFYAGVPLVASDGSKIGTLCVLDRVPRTLDSQLAILREMSRLATAHAEMRRELSRATSSNDELSAALDAYPQAVITGLIDGTVTGWNDAATRTFGWSKDEVLGQRHSFVQPEFEHEAQTIRTRVIDGGEIVTRRRALGVHKSGRLLDLAFSAKPIFDSAGAATGAVYVVEDVTESSRARQIERRRSEILELAAGDAPLADVLNRLVQNVEFTIAGSLATILRLRGERLFHEAAGAAIPDAYARAIDGIAIGPNEGSCGSSAFRGETVVVADVMRDPLWEKYRGLALAHDLRSCWSTPIRSSSNHVLGTFAIYTREPREPTTAELRYLYEAAHVAAIAMETHETRARLEHLAHHDVLTDLPNRVHFEERLRAALEAARLSRKRVALGVLDLHRFKVVNDTLGHGAGDQLLREIAGRLNRSVRPQDTLARLGSDEFFFLLADIDDREMAETMARRLTSALEQSFMPAGHEIFIQATIGMSLYPDDTREPTQLLRLADEALSAARTRGDVIGFYAGPQRHDGLTRLALEAGLNHALENEEFELHYQPQLNVASGTIFGAEALLRWNHPQLGRLMPDRFIRIAEETGLIVSIGAWVIAEACRFGRRWLDAGGPGVVTVNVSPRQFEGVGLVETVVTALEDADLPAEKLWLEITESLIMRSPETAAATIADLRAIGVRTFIDDFGTGYSSLNHLKRFPVDGLKVDQTFLRDIGGPRNTASDAVLVRAILGVGRAMNLRIVAEGVETQEQHAFLSRFNGDIEQGYLFSRPIPEREFLAWRAS